MSQRPHYKKTRIAPTPSGLLHVGNAFSFLLTAALAKRSGAKLLLRIDDLDQQRVRPEYVADIFETLRFLNIQWDEGPRSVSDFEAHFAQQHRKPLYQSALQKLQEGKHLFACVCSRAQILRYHADGRYPGTCCNKGIPLDAPGVSWRLHTTSEITLRVKKIDGSHSDSRLPPHMQSFVVRKKDGAPSYQLASLVDDVHYGVDLVVRGADLWPSTLAQLYLATLLKQSHFLEAAFFHHPLLEDVAGNKLSKSAGAESVRFLRSEGNTRADLLQIFAQNKAILELLQTWL